MLLGLLLLGTCLPSLVFSQLFCNRCYGNSFCNNASHVDFDRNIANATCNVNVGNSLALEGIEDPMLRQIYKAINENTLKELDGAEATPFATIQGHCLTATVYEPHDTHTIRTCVTRNVPAGSNQSLCEILGTIVAPLNWYNGTFACRQCNSSHFCNNHTLSIGDGIAEPIISGTNMILASMIILLIALSIKSLF